MADVLEYPYKPNARKMLLAVLFFAVCAAVAFRAAWSNDRGLIVNGLVELSPRGAAVFWSCIGALSLAFVAGGAYGMHRGRTASIPVRLSDTELSAPRYGFSRRATVVPVRQIQDVSVAAYGRERWITVQHPAGTLNIMESMMPDPLSFEQLAHALSVRVRGPGG